MDSNYTFERVEELDDPRRCQGVVTMGQCLLVGVLKPDGTYGNCPAHGGPGQLRVANTAESRIYQAGKWRQKLTRITEQDGVKGLREEIGILRMLIDERLDVCKTQTDLMLHSGPLGELVSKVERLVVSCSRIETHLGQTLDKNQVLQLAQEFLEVIGKHVEDADTFEAIASEITARIAR